MNNIRWKKKNEWNHISENFNVCLISWVNIAFLILELFIDTVAAGYAWWHVNFSETLFFMLNCLDTLFTGTPNQCKVQSISDILQICVWIQAKLTALYFYKSHYGNLFIHFLLMKF